MTYRIENKYWTTKSEFFLLQNKLIKQGMEEIHSERIVSSCYFDTNNLSLFEQSEEGTLPRKKIRIRWYDDVQKYQKELKVSSIEGRFKVTELLDQISTTDEIFRLKILDPDCGIVLPKVLVSYRRQYYKFKNLRITFDKNISYQKAVANDFFCLREPYCVMEVKAPVDTSEAYIQKLFPLTKARFSKYARGIIALKIK